MTHWQDPSLIDRCPDARRDAGVLAALASDPRSRLLMFTPHGAPELTEDGSLRAHTLTDSDPSDLLLGQADGHLWWARALPDVAGTSARLLNLAPLASELVMMAVALIEWHATAPACQVCGADTEVAGAGAWRSCSRCGAQTFPRQDPAVIVAVTDPDDRLLLAHAAPWSEGRVSVLAGFVEAGESAEQACHREVAEEVAVSLTSVTYAGSQPWPFPRSLMLGFHARAVDRRLDPDGVEIGWARYYTREELTAAVTSGEVTLPGPASIAHHLIQTWRAGGFGQG